MDNDLKKPPLHMFSMVAPVGPLATIDRELRQARKGATVAIDSCAGVWLVGGASSFPFAILALYTRYVQPNLCK